MPEKNFLRKIFILLDDKNNINYKTKLLLKHNLIAERR